MDHVTDRANQDQEIAALWRRWQATPLDVQEDVAAFVGLSGSDAAEQIATLPVGWLSFILQAASIGLREMVLQCDD